MPFVPRRKIWKLNEDSTKEKSSTDVGDVGDKEKRGKVEDK